MIESQRQGVISSRSVSWRLRSRELVFPRRPLVMGILNVTPDSFSDGGKFFDERAAIEHGLQLVGEGAEILDVGGESTRPYASPVEAPEELRRVERVIRTLARQSAVPISIDTTKPVVAKAALDAGAEIINDVSGFRDPEMVRVAADSQAGVCVMHMRGTPQTMQDAPRYEDLIGEIVAYLQERRHDLCEAGISETRICLDPGIGFGKTNDHNIELMANAWKFHNLNGPLLFGPSRKAFLGKLIGDKTADRTAATIGAACALAEQGVQIVRVHDVAAVRQSLVAWEACRARE